MKGRVLYKLEEEKRFKQYISIYMFHSEIMTSKNLFPWIGEQPYIEMLFGQFSNINTYVKIVGKMQDQHFTVSIFSNPGDKTKKE